jgi:hypothetical protein
MMRARTFVACDIQPILVHNNVLAPHYSFLLCVLGGVSVSDLWIHYTFITCYRLLHPLAADIRIDECLDFPVFFLFRTYSSYVN